MPVLPDRVFHGLRAVSVRVPRRRRGAAELPAGGVGVLEDSAPFHVGELALRGGQFLDGPGARGVFGGSLRGVLLQHFGR